MNVHLKVFPIYGVNDTSKLLDIELAEGGSIEDMLKTAQDRIGNRIPKEGIMLLRNGKAVDLKKAGSLRLESDDWLFLMPIICGG